MDGIIITPDHMGNIKFWVEAIQIPGLSSETKELLEKCLRNELRNFIEPHIEISAEVLRKAVNVERGYEK